MNDVVILMETDQYHYETGRLSPWFKAFKQITWWDEIFNIKYVDIRKKMAKIAKKTLDRANPTIIYHYFSEQVVKEIKDKHHAWVVLIGDDDFLSCKVIQFLANCNDYGSLVHWNAVISLPFANRWEDPNHHPYDFINEKTYCHKSICTSDATLYTGTYAIHTSGNLISQPWESSVLQSHMLTSHIKENRLFVPELEFVYTGTTGYSRLRHARNRQDLCNFVSFFKNSYVKYPQEFKQEEILVNELMKSIELTERGRQLGLRLSKVSSNSVVSLL